MAICSSCLTGYDDSLNRCPNCRAPKSPPGAPFDIDEAIERTNSANRCGRFAMFCLHMARLMSLLGAIVCFIAGIVVLFRGEILDGLVALGIITPIAVGQYVAFGLAIQYAERR